MPLDYFEEVTTCLATKVLVNSHFTASIFKSTFKRCRSVKPLVLYPVPNTDNLALPKKLLCQLDPMIAGSSKRGQILNYLKIEILPPNTDLIFVSINRYERKKNIGLGIRAFGFLLKHWEELGAHYSSINPSSLRLVITGGYDSLVRENVDYYFELVELVRILGLSDHVTFICSCSSEIKSALISSASAVLYTPENEHFGIVPVEAMYLETPVIALDSGGPAETIKSGQTGFLCSTQSTDEIEKEIAANMVK